MFTVVGVHVWATFGMALVVFLAGFATLDAALLDAARVDGASLPQTIWHVIIPSLSRTIQFVFVTTMIGMLTSMFGLLFVMTSGGPEGSTYLPEYYIWIQQGQMNRPALASAASTVLFLDHARGGARCRSACSAAPGGRTDARHAAGPVAGRRSDGGARAGDDLSPAVHRQRRDEDPARLHPRPVLPDATPCAGTTSPTAWTSAGMARYFVNSLIVVTVAVALLLLLGSMAGFALSQLRFRGSSALFLGCLAALFIPFQVIMVPLARIMADSGLIDTYPGLILAYVAQFLPVHRSS